MKNKLKYIYLSIVATLIFVFTLTLVNTKTYAWTYNQSNDTVTSDNLCTSILNDTSWDFWFNFYAEPNTSYSAKVFNNNVVSPRDAKIGLVLDSNKYSYVETYYSDNYTHTLTMGFSFTTGNITEGNYKIRFQYNSQSNFTGNGMIIKGSIAPTNYEPYGSYVNQNLYDTLEEQYNDLQDDFDALENQYDTLSSNYATLQQNYNDLQSQYNTLNNTYNTYVNSHSYTNTEYQELQSQITTLQSQISTLQTQYQDLLLQYNNLQSDYNVLYNSSSIGWFSFVNRIGYFKSLNPITTDEKDLSYLVNNNYIIGDTFNIGQFVDENSTTGFNLTELSFERQKVLLEELSFTINDYDDFSILRIQIYNPYTDETTVEVQWNFQIYGNVINERSVYSAVNGYVVSDAEWEEYIEDNDIRNFNSLDRMIFVNFTGYDTTIITNSSVDGQSYIKGFSAGIASQNLNYNQVRQDYQRVLLEKNDILYEYNVLKQDYLNLSANYNSLQTSYNNSLEGNNFVSLFFTIAETPFASFKQIWNVDFLGVNLSGFVTGLLFIGLLIWLVKKIF